LEALENSMDIQTIKERITKAIAEGDVDVKGIQFEYPADLSHGDLSTNIAMVRAGQTGVAPKEIAEKIVSLLHDIDGVEKVEVAGPGFINFYFTKGFFAENINAVNKAKEKWGKNDLHSGKKIMVEYTDPNPFKVFHIGHLMSNAIGESVARLIEFAGADVKCANYQGDVGPHVAKAIWGKKTKPELSWGEAYAFGSQSYEENKVEIDLINKSIYEKSDTETNQMYEKGRQESLDEFEKIYKILGTKFDYYFFESESAPIGVQIVKEHPEVFEESDGAIVYKGEQDGLHTRVFITSNGLPTYETKDLGLIKLKNDTEQCDVSISITAEEQKEYFKVMLAAAKRVMPELAGKIVHVTHGMMRLPSGKMSSRTGEVISGESLIKEMIKKALERSSESRAEDSSVLAERVAVAAIKYQILKQSAGKDIIFDEERALSIEGDSGPYLQYTYARTQAILNKAEEEGIKMNTDVMKEVNEVSRILYRFSEIVEHSTKEYEPHHVTTFLTTLASAFNSWYAQEQILDGTKDASHKVALTAAVAHTLKNGLWLLGIEAPSRM